MLMTVSLNAIDSKMVAWNVNLDSGKGDFAGLNPVEIADARISFLSEVQGSSIKFRVPT
jgi:hypothetical protein